MIQIDRNITLKNVTNVINEKSPSFSGIVSQECKGKLWVDEIENPRIALAESYAVGSFAFLGIYEVKEDFIKLRAFLENELFLSLKKNGYNCFEFSVESENIHKNIIELFQDKSIQTEKEFSFRAYEIPKSDLILTTGYQIRKVDDTFWKMLLEGRFENQDFLQTRILESWRSFEEFMNKSLAYCITFENSIAAVMVGTARYNNVIAIDIETEEQNRRMGLAYAIAVEFIADCLRNDITPQWDCVESNQNSYHLAKKLGLKKVNENLVYWFDL